MSYWVAGAVVVGAVAGSKSSKDASDAAADSAKKGIAATQSSANQARTDAINLFASGGTSTQSGINSALRFYQNNAQARVEPFVQGNYAAQQVLGQGATQANNAILGLPVDMAFANTPRTLGADYSGITSAALPKLGVPFSQQEAEYNAKQAPIIAAAQAKAAEDKAAMEDVRSSAKYLNRW